MRFTRDENVFLSIYASLDPAPDHCSECGDDLTRNFPKQGTHKDCAFAEWVERAALFWFEKLELLDVFHAGHPGLADMKFEDFLSAIARGENVT